jgi:hypothetical protein
MASRRGLAELGPKTWPQTEINGQQRDHPLYFLSRRCCGWLARAFGFAATMRTAPPGMHGEMTLDGQRIMMGRAARNGEW